MKKNPLNMSRITGQWTGSAGSRLCSMTAAARMCKSSTATAASST
jgi:hypothetical protein